MKKSQYICLITLLIGVILPAYCPASHQEKVASTEVDKTQQDLTVAKAKELVDVSRERDILSETVGNVLSEAINSKDTQKFSKNETINDKLAKRKETNQNEVDENLRNSKEHPPLLFDFTNETKFLGKRETDNESQQRQNDKLFTGDKELSEDYSDNSRNFRDNMQGSNVYNEEHQRKKHKEVFEKPFVASKVKNCKPDEKLEKVVPEMIFKDVDIDKEDEPNCKKLENMIKVMDCIMAEAGPCISKELGLGKRDKNINTLLPQNEDKMKANVLAIANCAADILKQHTQNCCITLPKDLHAFLIWILFGEEDNNCSCPIDPDAKPKPSYLFRDSESRKQISGGGVGYKLQSLYKPPISIQEAMNPNMNPFSSQNILINQNLKKIKSNLLLQQHKPDVAAIHMSPLGKPFIGYDNNQIIDPGLQVKQPVDYNLQIKPPQQPNNFYRTMRDLQNNWVPDTKYTNQQESNQDYNYKKQSEGFTSNIQLRETSDQVEEEHNRNNYQSFQNCNTENEQRKQTKRNIKKNPNKIHDHINRTVRRRRVNQKQFLSPEDTQHNDLENQQRKLTKRDIRKNPKKIYNHMNRTVQQRRRRKNKKQVTSPEDAQHNNLVRYGTTNTWLVDSTTRIIPLTEIINTTLTSIADKINETFKETNKIVENEKIFTDVHDSLAALSIENDDSNTMQENTTQKPKKLCVRHKKRKRKSKKCKDNKFDYLQLENQINFNVSDINDREEKREPTHKLNSYGEATAKNFNIHFVKEIDNEQYDLKHENTIPIQEIKPRKKNQKYKWRNEKTYQCECEGPNAEDLSVNDIGPETKPCNGQTKKNKKIIVKTRLENNNYENYDDDENNFVAGLGEKCLINLPSNKDYHFKDYTISFLDQSRYELNDTTSDTSISRDKPAKDNRHIKKNKSDDLKNTQSLDFKEQMREPIFDSKIHSSLIVRENPSTESAEMLKNNKAHASDIQFLDSRNTSSDNRETNTDLSPPTNYLTESRKNGSNNIKKYVSNANLDSKLIDKVNTQNLKALDNINKKLTNKALHVTKTDNLSDKGKNSPDKNEHKQRLKKQSKHIKQKIPKIILNFFNQNNQNTSKTSGKMLVELSNLLRGSNTDPLTADDLDDLVSQEFKSFLRNLDKNKFIQQVKSNSISNTKGKNESYQSHDEQEKPSTQQMISIISEIAKWTEKMTKNPESSENNSEDLVQPGLVNNQKPNKNNKLKFTVTTKPKTDISNDDCTGNSEILLGKVCKTAEENNTVQERKITHTTDRLESNIKHKQQCATLKEANNKNEFEQNSKLNVKQNGRNILNETGKGSVGPNKSTHINSNKSIGNIKGKTSSVFRNRIDRVQNDKFSNITNFVIDNYSNENLLTPKQNLEATFKTCPAMVLNSVIVSKSSANDANKNLKISEKLQINKQVAKPLNSETNCTHGSKAKSQSHKDTQNANKKKSKHTNDFDLEAFDDEILTEEELKELDDQDNVFTSIEIPQHLQSHEGSPGKLSYRTGNGTNFEAKLTTLDSCKQKKAIRKTERQFDATKKLINSNENASLKKAIKNGLLDVNDAELYQMNACKMEETDRAEVNTNNQNQKRPPDQGIKKDNATFQNKDIENAERKNKETNNQFQGRDGNDKINESKNLIVLNPNQIYSKVARKRNKTNTVIKSKNQRKQPKSHFRIHVMNNDKCYNKKIGFAVAVTTEKTKEKIYQLNQNENRINTVRIENHKLEMLKQHESKTGSNREKSEFSKTNSNKIMQDKVEESSYTNSLYDEDDDYMDDESLGENMDELDKGTISNDDNTWTNKHDKRGRRERDLDPYFISNKHTYMHRSRTVQPTLYPDFFMNQESRWNKDRLSSMMFGTNRDISQHLNQILESINLNATDNIWNKTKIQKTYCFTTPAYMGNESIFDMSNNNTTILAMIIKQLEPKSTVKYYFQLGMLDEKVTRPAVTDTPFQMNLATSPIQMIWANSTRASPTIDTGDMPVSIHLGECNCAPAMHSTPIQTSNKSDAEIFLQNKYFLKKINEQLKAIDSLLGKPREQMIDTITHKTTPLQVVLTPIKETECTSIKPALQELTIPESHSTPE